MKPSWVLPVAALLVISACTQDASPGALTSTKRTNSTQTGVVNPEATPQWPPVSIPPEEFFGRVGDCLEDEGFSVEVNPAEYTLTYRGTQRQAFDAARDACMNAIDPSYLSNPPPFTEQQLVELYDYAIDKVDCLEELGYPRVDLPSFDVFANELSGRFDPVGQLFADGDSVDDEDMLFCRSRAKPLWFVP